MDRISKIVSIINEKLTSALGLSGFVYGLCEKIATDSKTIFIEKKANGLQKPVCLDDSEPLTIIHYSDNIQTETDNEAGFGSSPMISETNSNVALIYIPNANNESESKKILQKLTIALPVTICRDDKILIKVRGVNISVESSSYNKHVIFSEEFTGQSDNLQDNNILIKISYQVVIKLDRSCQDWGCLKEESCTTNNTWGGNAEL